MAQAHTARFLQTFHTGMTTVARTAASETAIPTDHADTDPAALAFVKGGPAAPLPFSPGQRIRDGLARQADSLTALIHIKGYAILTGPGLITEKQAAYVIGIAETREGVTDAMVKSLSERLEQGFARAAASDFISKYSALPRKAQPVAVVKAETTSAADEVPAGRYALRGEDGVVKFYKLDRPTQGRWAGYTFLKAQASDDLWPVKNPMEKARILGTIAQDVLAAERLYGTELGKCSRCGRTLTDETSRAYGIGPECRKK